MTRNIKSGPASGDVRGTPLPHDRDEAPTAPSEDGQHRANRAPMRRAHADVESGLVDTERVGTPNDVPSSGQDGRR